MKAYVFPGQGVQYSGMGKELYKNKKAKIIFEQANEILGFRITDIMFNGKSNKLKQTCISQLAIYIYSIILVKTLDNFKPDMVAGHSLGEFSALVAAGGLDFETGLDLVYKRAIAMQQACEIISSGMAAIIGLEDNIVEEICNNVKGIVVPANYNCPKQLVISGEKESLKNACAIIKKNKNFKRIFILKVGGAFHSPLMNSAKKKLKNIIKKIFIKKPFCLIYQNKSGKGCKDPYIIKNNLIEQLTSPVKWKQSIKKMIFEGADVFIEVGPGKVLQGLIKKINPQIKTYSGK